jgi:thiol:disulfide interchange protein DsbC
LIVTSLVTIARLAQLNHSTEIFVILISPQSKISLAMKASSLTPAFIAAALVFGAAVHADDLATAAAKDRITEKLKVPRENIRPAPIPGLYEIQHQHDFAYVTEDGKFLLRGDLINIETGEEVTENHRRGDRLAAIKDLGTQNFIVFAPSPPIATKYTVTVFTDVDCGYCRKLHSQIADYNAKGISIRYAFYPRSGPDTESWHRAEAVWCATDRKAAMTQAKSGGTVKSGGKACENPVAKEYQLAEEIGIRGTPMLVLPNGDIYPGYAPPNVLAAKLAELDPDTKAKPKG